MIRRPTYEIYVGESLPDFGLFLVNDTQLVTGLSSGYTFELKVLTLADEEVFTKTDGIIGQTGNDFPPLGTPNVVIQWAGELAALSAGTYKAQLKMTRTADSKVRFEQWLIVATATF